MLSRLDFRAQCSQFVPMSQAPEDGQIHTLGLLEQLREECQQLWGTSSEFYFRIDELLRELANPNLHDIPTRLPFRVELWDRHDQHIRWVIAAASSVAVGNRAVTMISKRSGVFGSGVLRLLPEASPHPTSICDPLASGPQALRSSHRPLRLGFLP